MNGKHVVLLSVVLVCGLMSSACANADLRTGTLEALGAQPSKDNAAQARAVLQATAERHGVDAWRQYSTAEVIMRDDWDSVLASVLGLEPWDEEDLIQMRYEPGSFDIRVDFIDGPRKGEAMGLQSWKTYGRSAQQEPLAFGEVEHADFVLPAIVYLAELPFRVAQAPVLAYHGQEEVDGRVYDVVMATWGSLEPNDQHDQYLMWIDTNTDTLTMVDHTVREQGGFFSSRTIYEDYRDVQGVLVAHRLTIVDRGETSTDGYLHQIHVESAAFDAFPAAWLHPDQQLKPMGDAKASR